MSRASEGASAKTVAAAKLHRCRWLRLVRRKCRHRRSRPSLNRSLNLNRNLSRLSRNNSGMMHATARGNGKSARTTRVIAANLVS